MGKEIKTLKDIQGDNSLGVLTNLSEDQIDEIMSSSQEGEGTTLSPEAWKRWIDFGTSTGVSH